MSVIFNPLVLCGFWPNTHTKSDMYDKYFVGVAIGVATFHDMLPLATPVVLIIIGSNK